MVHLYIGFRLLAGHARESHSHLCFKAPQVSVQLLQEAVEAAVALAVAAALHLHPALRAGGLAAHSTQSSRHLPQHVLEYKCIGVLDLWCEILLCVCILHCRHAGMLHTAPTAQVS